MSVGITRLFEGRPILEARPGHAWESRVVLNPAADHLAINEPSDIPAGWDLTADQARAIVKAGGVVVLLYRAQGAPAPGDDVAPSSLGLAVFTPDFRLVKRWSRPVVAPDAKFQNLGVEDPRITRVGETWHAYYTGYSGDPRTGRWDGRAVKICHATTKDFVDWRLKGPIQGTLNDVPNKNAALLPETAGESWILLHRPMDGENAMSICWAVSDSQEGPWQERGTLMKGLDRPDCSKSWIGAGGPPVSLGGGRFLMIYHRGAFDHSDRREYDLGAALLDFTQSTTEIVASRIEPIMRPTGALEQIGDPDVGVDNVLFTCANYVQGDRLVIPYAGADSRIFVASVDVRQLLSALENALDRGVTGIIDQ